MGHGLGDGAMAQQGCVVLSAAEREQLVAIAADRTRPRKHAERARIVLVSADRYSAQRTKSADPILAKLDRLPVTSL